MLDINLFRVDKGGNPDLVRDSQRKRGKSVELVDEVIALDQAWVKKRFEADQAQKNRNAVQKEIGAKMKAKQPCDDLLAKKVEYEKESERLNKEANELEEARNKKLILIGNIVHDSVIASVDEANNELVRLWPEGKVMEPDMKSDIYYHFEVLQQIGAFDLERGQKVAGHRGYFLKDWGVLLNQALINYGLAFLRKKGYIPLQTPFFMLKEVMAETAQLEQFDEELYHVTGEGGDKYLIATSEQPISAFHRKEWIEPSELPLKYAGISTCFRKEAGAHGRDTWGIYRIHQFEKVEQFVLTKPEESWDVFEQMMALSEEFYQSLNIPYRVVGIVGGALNNAAAKKWDLEAWFPGYGEYRELVSCSNCTDYQSRHLEIRYGQATSKNDTEKDKKKYVHCLNSTLCATERALCCIAENYQDNERKGLRVPEVLIPFMGGVDFIPYTKPLSDKDRKPRAVGGPRV